MGAGFLAAVEWHKESWREFLADENEAGAIIPMYALAHENDPDPELRFEPPSAEKRRELLSYMVAGLMRIHSYFKARRSPPLRLGTYVRSDAKVGRNDPCPCGSGKKHKHCCLRNTH